MKLTLGQRIYYTGDMANSEDSGTVVRVEAPSRFAQAGTYDVDLDDGRKMRGLYPNSFDPGPGRRFWPLDEWLADRQRRMEDAQRHMRAILDRKDGAPC